ncbi:hypothetical protein DPMN_123054 [Dreissena polymorpha]|uniref:C-type lectin domain-containing protein n=1 Tax=Dreissena polymorpha TaxID=45954 RepID=A0A9D4GTQ9_DREPO|nr:hypothetical protein DPMN_123054 [Dreissena polymorpha]
MIDSTVVEHSGKTVKYTYWALGEPNGSGNGTCTAFVRYGWAWVDIVCSYLDHVVCEHD